jgi:hypothetical protein
VRLNKAVDMHYSKTVVIVGNGESRSSLDLSNLKNTVTLIGCNAIHRDLAVDHLVCCDQRMVKEAVANKSISHIYTRPRYFRDFHKILQKDAVNNLPDLPYEGTLKPDQPEHWGSGPYAMLLAAHLKFKSVYMIGFDLYGKNRLVNNVYKNTNNYLPATKPAVDPAYWIYQGRKVFQCHESVKFKIFNLPEWSLPIEWQLPNVEVFDLNKFRLELANEVNTLYT